MLISTFARTLYCWTLFNEPKLTKIAIKQLHFYELMLTKMN